MAVFAAVLQHGKRKQATPGGARLEQHRSRVRSPARLTYPLIAAKQTYDSYGHRIQHPREALSLTSRIGLFAIRVACDQRHRQRRF